VRIATARRVGDQESLAVDEEQVLDSEGVVGGPAERNESGGTERADEHGEPGP